jgi:hypothetical protein
MAKKVASDPTTSVWIIDFSQGGMFPVEKTSNYNVRLVRDDVTN